MMATLRILVSSVLSTSLLLLAHGAMIFPISSALATPKVIPLLHPRQHQHALKHTKPIISSLSTNSILNIRGGDIAETAATTTTAALNAVPTWVKICGKLAPLTSIGVSMAPIPTILSISKSKSVGDLPLLPYTSLISNAFIWTMYGVLLKEPKLWSCNSASILLGILYFKAFTKHCPKQSPTLPGSVQRHLQVCLGIIAIVTGIALKLPTMTAAKILGTTGVVLCVGLFASPLAAIGTVLRTKSAKSIPLPFTIATVVNCALWSVLGILDMKDVNIYLPNVLGLSAGLAQVALKLRYGDGNGVGEEKIV